MGANSHRQTRDLSARACVTKGGGTGRMLPGQDVAPGCGRTGPTQRRLGLDGLVGMILRFQRACPGNTPRSVRFDEHIGRSPAAWGQIDGEGCPVPNGTGHSRRGGDGRLVKVTGSFPTPG